MNDHEFVTALHQDIVDNNWHTYRQLFTESEPASATDPYWHAALLLYADLDPAGRETLLRIVRQVMVDTLSNVLGLLDGVTALEQQDGELALTLSGQRLDGTLQDQFLELEEERGS
jgi:hypothetical protein